MDEDQKQNIEMNGSLGSAREIAIRRGGVQVDHEAA